MTNPCPHRPSRRTCPALLRRSAAADFLSLGVSTFDRHDAAGLIPEGIRLSGAKCWSRAELSEWCRRGCPPRAEWAPIWAALNRARFATRK